jgi:hypothetical protein
MDSTSQTDNGRPMKRATVNWPLLIKRTLVFLAVYFAAYLLALPAWSYLKLRWSPHGRALFAAKGERVVYMDLYGHNPPTVLQGTMKNIWMDWESAKLGLFVVRFDIESDMINEIPSDGSCSSTLTASDFNLLQPLERPILGRFDPSFLYSGTLLAALPCWLIIMGVLSVRWPPPVPFMSRGSQPHDG